MDKNKEIKFRRGHKGEFAEEHGEIFVWPSKDGHRVVEAWKSQESHRYTTGFVVIQDGMSWEDARAYAKILRASCELP